MKVLVVGDWHSEVHEEVVAVALRQLGHDVEELRWCRYFQSSPDGGGRIAELIRRAQNKYLFGPAMGRISRHLVALAQQWRPDLVFVYRGTHVLAKTLRAIKASLPDCVLVGYNNDDPFSPDQPRYLWRHFLRAVPDYDLMLAYRHLNIQSTGRLVRAGSRCCAPGSCRSAITQSFCLCPKRRNSTLTWCLWATTRRTNVWIT